MVVKTTKTVTQVILLPPTDTALDGLHKALDDANETDHMSRQGKQLRSIIADWYEERGSPIAQAIRWQIKARKRPYDMGHGPWRWIWFDGSRVWWYDDPSDPFVALMLAPVRIQRRARMDPASDLPAALWGLIGKRRGRGHWDKNFRTRRAAEEALWLAWLSWKRVSC